MKCRDCGTLQGNRHKGTCPVTRYMRPPFYVANVTYDQYYAPIEEKDEQEDSDR